MRIEPRNFVKCDSRNASFETARFLCVRNSLCPDRLRVSTFHVFAAAFARSDIGAGYRAHRSGTIRSDPIRESAQLRAKSWIVSCAVMAACDSDCDSFRARMAFRCKQNDSKVATEIARGPRLRSVKRTEQKNKKERLPKREVGARCKLQLIRVLQRECT